MRYAEAKYGEYATAFGEFSTGRTGIEIALYKGSDGSAETLSSNTCAEVGSTGVFRWRSSDITTQPTEYTEYLFVMTDNTPVVGTGRTQKGKIIVGGYPSDSAKRRFNGRVWIDTGSGNSGTGFPTGAEDKPVDNLADAVLIAAEEDLTAYNLRGSIQLTSAHTNWRFYGVSPEDAIIDVNGQSVAGSEFDRIGIRNAVSGSISCSECLIGISGGTVSGLQGTFTSCGFDGTIQPAYGGGARIQGLNLAAQNVNVGDPGTILDYQGELCVVIGEFKGIWKIRNIDDPAAVVAFACSGAEINLNSSIDGGYFFLLGDGEVTGIATSTGTWNDRLLRGSRLNECWNGEVGTREVNEATDPWSLLVRKGDDDSTTSHSYDLYDETGAINNSNPLTQYVKRRVRI
jgi:type 1 fimbria pilin